MTDLDKKHNVLNDWNLSQDEYYIYLNDFFKQYAFEIAICMASNETKLHVFDRNISSEKPMKTMPAKSIDNAKAQAELFILNLKR